MWYGKVTNLEPVTRSVSFLGSKADLFTIENIRLSDDAPEGSFSWNLKDNRAENRGITLEVVFHPEKAFPGRFMYQLFVETDLPDTPEYAINLGGELEGVVYSIPSRVVFANFQLAIPVKETLTIKTHLQKPFSITKVDSFDSEITVDYIADVSGPEHQVFIHFKPVTERQILQTQILISTDLDNQSDILIDIHGFQRRERRKISLRD